jgi:hypothetical protein
MVSQSILGLVGALVHAQNLILSPLDRLCGFIRSMLPLKHP